jgi:hypothetical protein
VEQSFRNSSTSASCTTTSTRIQTPYKGIPKVYYCSTEDNSHTILGEFNVLVMDLMGPSLESLFNQTHRKFSLQTVLLLFDQMISSIEYLHNREFNHWDIKPDNFCVGLNKTSHKIFILERYIRTWLELRGMPPSILTMELNRLAEMTCRVWAMWWCISCGVCSHGRIWRPTTSLTNTDSSRKRRQQPLSRFCN